MSLQLKSNKVCVVGGGASGLVAARELRKEGHVVVVFERGSQLGGTWIYTPEVESDLLGLDSTRKLVYSSMYKSLRTNLAREAMGFTDFPFVNTGKADRDSRRFPAHQEVLRYLEDFAHEFGLNDIIHYQTDVRHVGLKTDGKWTVTYQRIGEDGGSEVNETYDAVVVCNGHYTEPHVATEIPGIDLWPGRQIHSHNYRVPEPYQDQVVVLIGLSASAIDISRDIARLAKEVHIATRSEAKGIMFGKHPVYGNMWLHPMIEIAHEDGRISFQDGSEVLADIILHCTGTYAASTFQTHGAFHVRGSDREYNIILDLNQKLKLMVEAQEYVIFSIRIEQARFNTKYKYHFPFLDTGGAVNVDDNRVGPLYKHVFPPTLAPGLSFVGIPMFVSPFYVSELQSKWIAGILSGRISLPSEEKMMEDIEAFYKELEVKGIPKRHTHRIRNLKALVETFEYEDWLAAQCGYPPAEEWRKGIYFKTGARFFRLPESYRDEWDDDDLVMQAHEAFTKYLSGKQVAIASPTLLI